MNSNSLAKLYGQLTARERLPLLVAAALRKDEPERQRLIESAPQVQLRVRDYSGLSKALAEAADLHLLMLLDLAANFWQWWGLWMARGGRAATGQEEQKSRAKAKADKAREFRRYCLVCYHAYRFQVHVEAWKQFCSAFAIDAEGVLNFLPGWDMITRTTASVKELAFTGHDAALFLLSEARESAADEAEEVPFPQVETVEGLASVWHTIVNQRQRWWMGDSDDEHQRPG